MAAALPKGRPEPPIRALPKGRPEPPADRVAPNPRPTPAPNLAIGPPRLTSYPQFRGKPFLAAGIALSDYGALSAPKIIRERIEGVSHSLPNSDMLTLTSSHMFICVMA